MYSTEYVLELLCPTICHTNLPDWTSVPRYFIPGSLSLSWLALDLFG